MNSNQERAVHIHKAELHRRLTPVVEPFLAFVCARNVIRSGERSTILANVQPLDKLTMLLDMLQGKESGWTALLSFLREHDGRMLAASLQRDAGESETQLATATGSNSDDATKRRQGEIIENLKEDIVDALEYDVESVLNHFQLKNALTFENTQIIDAANTNRKKLTTLLSRLHGIDNGWDVLISYLDRTNRKNLARKLENAAKMPV